MSHQLSRTLRAACVGFVFVACGSTELLSAADDTLSLASERDGTDIQQALSAMSGVSVLSTQRDGTPDFIKGHLGTASASARGLAAADVKATVKAALASIAPVYRLHTEDLVFQRMTVDEQGHQHLRFSQLKNGFPVIGGELLLHVDPDGVVYAANGSARDSLQPSLPLVQPRISAEAAARGALEATSASNREARAERLVYVRDVSDQLVLAHEVRVQGLLADDTPVDDRVYVNANTSAVELRAPRIFNAKNRKVYSGNNRTTLPGTLRRSEGGAATGDTNVDGTYDVLGTVYECFKAVFGIDSYNNAGAVLISTTHYSTNYVNAYWNGTQMVCGDGDGANSSALCKDLDVVAHELYHAVTESTSNLTYAGESGGLNESFSDAAAAICESWTRGFVLPDPDIWKIGEDVWTPATPGDALRYMDDPVRDGISLDYYPNYNGNTDVHYSSGISNLAFALLAKGGTHPRGKTSVVVPGIGVEKAAHIWHWANANIFTASTNFAQAKTYTEQSALQLYGQTEANAVSAAWQAVGVGVVSPPPPTQPLTNGVATAPYGGAVGSMTCWTLDVPAGKSSLVFNQVGGTGNTGDADLYVRLGAAPTTTTYNCRPYLSGNSETCTLSNPAAGTWYACSRGYSAFTNVTMKGTY
ncbi:M4 family metallopeptidase [Hyalangium versicolor]|uniref:M4 family metallopeptidase n=1 Tax=Hyalangium versicolor TaxID=2861190 RepID=UPI001CC994F2|nr:M4 family metallopeptidase [Hyalangium versicolor]